MPETRMYRTDYLSYDRMVATGLPGNELLGKVHQVEVLRGAGKCCIQPPQVVQVEHFICEIALV